MRVEGERDLIVVGVVPARVAGAIREGKGECGSDKLEGTGASAHFCC